MYFYTRSSFLRKRADQPTTCANRHTPRLFFFSTREFFLSRGPWQDNTFPHQSCLLLHEVYRSANSVRAAPLRSGSADDPTPSLRRALLIGLTRPEKHARNQQPPRGACGNQCTLLCTDPTDVPVCQSGAVHWANVVLPIFCLTGI